MSRTKNTILFNVPSDIPIKYTVKRTNYLIQSKYAKRLRDLMLLMHEDRVGLDRFGIPSVFKSNGFVKYPCPHPIARLRQRNLIEMKGSRYRVTRHGAFALELAFKLLKEIPDIEQLISELDSNICSLSETVL